MKRILQVLDDQATALGYEIDRLEKPANSSEPLETYENRQLKAAEITGVMQNLERLIEELREITNK